MNLVNKKLEFDFVAMIILGVFLIIFSNARQANAATEFIKINSARVNAGYLTITWEWLGNDALGGGLGVVGIYPSLNNNMEGILGVPSEIIALHKNLDGNFDALETTWGRPRNDANPLCHRNITSPEEYAANTQYVTRFNKIFDPILNEYRAVNSISSTDKLRITITAGFPCTTTGQFRRADSEDYPIDFGAPLTSSLLSAPFWYQTLGNGLNFSVKDLTVHVSNPGVDAYYSGTIYGFTTDDYASGYGITPIEQYNFYNLGPSTPHGFDGNVTLSMQGNSLSSFPLNPNRYYKLSLNAGDTSRPFFIYGSFQDSYQNGKAYYSYSSYPCGPYFNPETTCEFGTNNGIADIFFQLGKAETLSGKESAVTTDANNESSPVIDGDLITWLDLSTNDIYVYEISTGRKIRVTNNNIYKTNIKIEGRKILWTETKGNFTTATFIYDINTGTTTELTEELTGEIKTLINISDFDGQRIALQAGYMSPTSISLYNLATSQLTLIDKDDPDKQDEVRNPKISGNKILYSWRWNCGMWCGQEELRLYDIVTGEKTKILNNYGFSSDYAIDGDNIVIVLYGQPSSIYRYKISTGEATIISSSFQQTAGIDISGNMVVWSDTNDIFVYDLATDKTGRTGMASRESLHPKVSGTTVVWEDYRAVEISNADIYMYRLASKNQPPTLSYSQETGYLSDTENPGVDPNKGTVETEFTFKTVYTDADNDVPQNISLIVGDDIATTTRALVLDTSVPLELRDGNYVNGEQFIATSTFPKKANYFYHFEASDGKGGIAHLPEIGDLQFSVINVPVIPVIIVPAIMGSLLDRDYINDKSQIWLPDAFELNNVDQFIKEMSFNSFGLPLFKIQAGNDIIRNVGIDDIFDTLITTLLVSGYYKEGNLHNLLQVPDANLFVFPYDWRKDVRESAVMLGDAIEAVKKNTGANSVDIITHSMGGLVAKYYISQHPTNFIRKFVAIGTPHIGAPEAFKRLLYGDDFLAVWPITNEEESKKIIRDISKNYPSTYDLLPSQTYVNTQNEQYLNNGQSWLDYAKTKDFVSDKLGDKSTFFSKAEMLHDSIDGMNMSQFNVDFYNIVGCDKQTIGAIHIVNDMNTNKEYDADFINGDGTVPLRSSFFSGSSGHTYFARTGVWHMSLPSAFDVPQLVESILSGKEFNVSNSMLYTGKGWFDFCGVGKKHRQFSTHSPVKLHVFDDAGNHTGPTLNGFIEKNVPDVEYETIEDNTFIVLPEQGVYHIVGNATGVGTFNARFKIIENETVTKTLYFNDVPLMSLNTQFNLDVLENKDPEILLLDQNGDGIFESQAQPSSVLNAEESQDLTKPKTTISLSGNQGQNNWYISDVKVSFSATDDNSGILKTEYSLDNGKNWNIYQQPFIITAESTTTILYFSTDRAGNYELLKSQEIKIDKTPPEVKISFDQNLKHLKVEGTDNLSSVSVIQNGNNYTLTDEAGHTLDIVFDKLKTEGKEIKAEIQSLRYDGVLTPAIPENKLQYEWSLEKDGGIKELNQRIEIENIFDVRARYDVKKNETIIDTKTGDGKDEKKTKQTRQGFVSLVLITNSGEFAISYYY